MPSFYKKFKRALSKDDSSVRKNKSRGSYDNRAHSADDIWDEQFREQSSIKTQDGFVDVCSSLMLTSRVRAMEQILKEVHLRDHLKDFLQSTHRMENYNFWYDINKLNRKRWDPAPLLTKSQKIFDKYVKPGSPQHVNLSSGIVSQITTALLNPPITQDIFDDSRDAVVSLMAFDCLHGFLDSEFFESLFEEQAEEEKKNKKGKKDKKDTKVAEGKTWLEMFDQAASVVPYPISVLDATKPSFPLALVNGLWEKMTEYNGKDLVEHGSGLHPLLCGAKTEESKVNLIHTLMQNGSGLDSMCVTHYKSSGTAFEDCIAMEPVRDRQGKLTYFVLIHIDADSNSNGTAGSLKRVGKLGSFLRHLPLVGRAEE